MFPAYSVEAQAPGFKANAATRELYTSAHQKHEPRRPVWVWCGRELPGAVNSHTPNLNREKSAVFATST